MKSHIVPELATDCKMIWVTVKHCTSPPTIVLMLQTKTARTSSVNPWMIPSHWRRHELPWLGLAIHDSEVGEPHARLHRKLMGLLHDRGLEQMVMEPMRLYNILDLYFRNAMLHTLDSGVQMVWMARIKKLSVVSKRLTGD